MREWLTQGRQGRDSALTRPAVLINVRPSLQAIVLPMLLGVAEFMLVYRPGVEVERGGMPDDWFAALAAWEILAGLMIVSVSSRLKGGVYDPALKQTISDNRRRLRINYLMALSSGCGTLAVYLLWSKGTWHASSTAKYVVLVVTALVLFGTINSHAKASAEIAENVDLAREELANQPPPSS
jgi:peptidoglycan/LPS O-acetylase OafA/YrhL